MGQEGDNRSLLPRHAHRVRASPLNSSLGVMGKTIPLCSADCLVGTIFLIVAGRYWGGEMQDQALHSPTYLKVCIQY